MSNISFPKVLQPLQYYSKGIHRGQLTLITGDPGAGASFFALQCLIDMHDDGHTLAIAAGDSAESMALDAACIRAQDGKLFDRQWILHNIGRAEELYETIEHWEQTFLEHVWALNDIEDLDNWVQTQIEDGVDVIGFHNFHPWGPDDRKSILKWKELAHKHDIALFIHTTTRNEFDNPADLHIHINMENSKHGRQLQVKKNRNGHLFFHPLEFLQATLNFKTARSQTDPTE